MSHPGRTIRAMPVDAGDRALRPAPRRRRCSTRSSPGRAATRSRRSPSSCPPTTSGSRRGGCSPAARSAGSTGHGDGIAGVTFLTVYRLAELLGAPRLAAVRRARCRPRCSRPRSGGARRRRRACSPRSPTTRPPSGRWSTRTASSQPSTTPRSTRCARTGRRASDVVRITARLAPSLAARVVRRARPHGRRGRRASARGVPLLADLGAVVVYLPQELSAPAASLLQRVAAARVPVTVVAGLTGVARADAAVRAARRAARRRPCADVARSSPTHGTRVVSASDPDDEVRAVVRVVVDALRDGVPLERMAVLYGAAEPYARLVHEQLDAAGIPHNGAAVRTLAESVLGRSLLGLLALPDRDFHRHDVMALLASAPVSIRGRPVPVGALGAHQPAARDRARSPTQWQRAPRPLRRARGARARGRSVAVTDRDPQPEWLRARARRPRATSHAFVAGLGRRRSPSAPRRSSVARAGGVGRSGSCATTSRHDGAGGRRGRRPSAQAADKVEAALDRLAGLDAVEPAPGLDVFRRTLELELDADLGRVGRLGDGVLVGHVALRARPRPRPRVRVRPGRGHSSPPGCATTRCSPTPTAAPPTARSRCARPRVDDDHRRLLAALAGGARDAAGPAASRAATCAAPPSACRRASCSTPSEALTARAGAPTISPSSTADGYRRSRRSPPASRASPFPATEQEHRLRALLDHARRGGAVADARAARASTSRCDAASSASLARASRAFTRFDGNLAGLDAVPSPTDDDASCRRRGSRRWARRPFDYFMEHVLRVEIPELPEEVLRSSRRSTAATSCTRRSTTFLARGARPARRRAGARRAVDRRRPGAAARDRRRTVRRLRGARAHRPPRCSGTATGAASSPSSTASSPTTPKLRAELRPHARSPPSCASASPDADPPAIESRCPTAARCASAARPTASTARADGTLSVIDYKTGRRSRCRRRRSHVRRAPSCSSRSTRTRRAASFGERRHAGRCRLLVREHARRVPVGRGRARRRRRDAVRRRAARHRRRHRARRVPVQRRPAEHVDAPVAQLQRPRRPRHPRPLPRVGCASAARPSSPAYVGARANPTTTVDERGRVEVDGRVTVVAARARASSLDEDAATRDAIVDDLDATLFVEAGAGSGKTKALVDRVVALVTRRATCPMREIAAVTFTEKAAAELRDRIRRALEADRAARRPSTDRRGAGSAAALDELDGAAIVHAALVRAADPHRAPDRGRAAAAHRGARRHRVAGRLRGALDPLRRRACSTTPRSSARCCSRSTPTPTLARPAHARARVQRQLGPRRRAHGPRARPAAARRELAPVLGAARRRCATRRPLHRRRRQAPRAARRARGLARPSSRTAPDESSSFALLHEGKPKFSATSGPEGQLARRGARSSRCATGSTALRDAGRPTPRPGSRSRWCAGWPGSSRSSRCAKPTARRRRGELEFHDLLVLARAVLRDPEHGWDVRRRLRGALPPPAARRVPGHRPDPVRARRAARVGRTRRRATAVGTRSRSTPGRLFVVGDPKQSIYRFRRADIATFLRRARSAFGAAPRSAHRATSAPPGR